MGREGGLFWDLWGLGSRVQNLGCEIQSSGTMENQVESTLKQDKEMGIRPGSVGLRRGWVLLRDSLKKGWCYRDNWEIR